MARVDFGVEISLNTKPIIPDGEDGISKQAFILGEITYDNDDPGYLIYIKTTLVNELPEDVLSYKRLDSRFPDQSTGDQFFDERQFEAYRELGYQIGKSLFKKSHGQKLSAWIEQEIETFKEMMTANSIQVDALTQLLIEKGLTTDHEFHGKLREVVMEYESKGKPSKD